MGSSSATRGEFVESLYAANSQITVEPIGYMLAPHEPGRRQELALSGSDLTTRFPRPLTTREPPVVQAPIGARN